MTADSALNKIEVRILGCLVEKERTTPQYYPLTLNALTNACNLSWHARARCATRGRLLEDAGEVSLAPSRAIAGGEIPDLGWPATWASWRPRSPS